MGDERTGPADGQGAFDELRSLIEGEAFSGAVLLARGGETLFQYAGGYAHRGWQIRNQIDTRFRIASVSKMFTAVAALQLVERGELALDAPAISLLKLERSSIPESVTVHHLLTMTAGIADWFDETGDWEANWKALLERVPVYLLRNDADYLPLFIDEPPVAAVGERHQYNGASYILLGLAIERVSGRPYREFVRQEVFARAGMADTGLDALDDPDPAMAEGYHPITNARGAVLRWKKNIYSVTPEPAADGGAVSTAGDLHRFLEAVRTNSLLSPRWSQAFLTPRVAQSPEFFRGYRWMYGYGNIFLLEDDRVVRYGHTGEEDGVSCRLYHYPELELDVILLGNESGSARTLGWGIHDHLLSSRGGVS